MKVLITAGFLLLSFLISAQNWSGFISSPYSGIYKNHVNPAYLVSSPYKYDINIAALGLSAVNAQVFADFIDAADDRPVSFLADADDFFLKARLQLPSIMMKINEKSAFAFEISMGASQYSQSSNEAVFNIVMDNFNNNTFYGSDFSNEFVTTSTNVWLSMEASYSRRIWSNGKNNLDAGLTLGLVDGQGSGYFNVDNLSFSLNGPDTLEDVSAVVQFVYDDNIENLLDGDIEFMSNPSLAASFGIHYQYSLPNDKFLDLGLSVTDIGRLVFTKDHNSGEFVLNLSDIPIEPFRQLITTDELGTTLESLLNDTEVEGDEFKIQLPTKLILEADYPLKNNFYLNMAAFVALVGTERSVRKVTSVSNYILTPRLEKPSWGLQMPFSYNRFTGFTAGASFRYKFFFVGFNNLFRAIFSDPGTVNAFIGFKVSKLKNN